MKKIVKVDEYAIDRDESTTVEYELEAKELEIMEKVEGNDAYPKHPEFAYNAMGIGNGLYILTAVDLRPGYAPTLKNEDGTELGNRSYSQLVDANGKQITERLSSFDGKSDKDLAEAYFDDEQALRDQAYTGLATYMGHHLDEVDKIPPEAFAGRGDILPEEILLNTRERILQQNNENPLTEQELKELQQQIDAAKDVFVEKQKALAEQEKLKNDILGGLSL